MNHGVSQHSFNGKSTKAADRRRQSSAAPWTASRCNRLLRTITSRIAVLRRLKKLDDQIRTAPPSSEEQPLPENRPSSSASEQDLSCPDSPEWIPRRGSRPIKRTYAGRKKIARKGPEQLRTQSDGAFFPTPLVKKILSHTQGNSPFTLVTASPSHSFELSQASHNRRSTKLPIRPLSSLEEAHRNLLAAFQTFLNSTRLVEPPSRTGAGSLLKMCLNKVAHYIELEEEAVALADGDNSQYADVAFDLYSELETLGTKVGGGWVGLRQIIRMHGIRHIELAIIDESIPTPLVDQLLDICDKLEAIPESHVIMEALSKRSNIDIHAFWFRRAQPCFAQGAAAYWLRSIAKLLASGRLSYQQFTKQTVRVLWRAFLRVLIERDYTATADLINAYIKSSINGKGGGNWPGRKRLFEGLVDVLGMLTAIFLTSEATTTRHNTIRLLHQVTTLHKFDGRSVALDSAMTTIMLIMKSTDNKLDQTLYSPPLGDLLERLQDMRQDLARKWTTSCSIVEIICTVVNTVAKIGAATRSVLLRKILSNLVRAPSASQTSVRRMLERLAHDCAVRHSEDTGDRSVIEAVEDGALYEDTEALLAPTASKARSDYRWEDGLCEWIAASPMARTGAAGRDAAPTSPFAAPGSEGAEQHIFMQLDLPTTIRAIPTPPVSSQDQLKVVQDTTKHTALGRNLLDSNRKSEEQLIKATIREPLADLGPSKQNRVLSPSPSLPDSKKRKAQTGNNGAADGRKTSEKYPKKAGNTQETNEQADELSLVTPLRPVPTKPPRKKVRWDVSCQDKIHTRPLAAKSRSDCRPEEACDLLSPVRPSFEADIMSEDELAI